MKKLWFLALVMLSLFLFGCSSNNVLDNEDIENNEMEELVSNNALDNFDITVFSKDILTLMENESFDELSAFVHPIKWVRFSPYTYIDVDNTTVLYPDDFNDFLDDTIHMWWYTDWAGFEIEETKYDYFKEWVYSTWFLHAGTTFIDQIESRWNNVNNIDDVFLNVHRIEYYFDWFNPEYEWIDWRSLTLVFEEYNWYYYLVWVVHGSWTI